MLKLLSGTEAVKSSFEHFVTLVRLLGIQASL